MENIAAWQEGNSFSYIFAPDYGQFGRKRQVFE